MKIILSRKGFDSQYGGQASPILPDGTMLSLPIPSDDELRFSEIRWGGLCYLDIIRQLKPSTKITEGSHCHLDPDLRSECIARPIGWMPGYGQTGSSLSELRNNGVEVGDIFLFFGWFRHTEIKNGRYRYVKGAKDLHVIYGYLQVGSIIEREEDIPNWLLNHPHASHKNYVDAWKKGLNAIYLPTDTLSLNPRLSGAGTFNFSPHLVLTKEGCSRSKWIFPGSMRGTKISHNPNGWKNGYFQSAAIGQEFVMDATAPVIEWVENLFSFITF
jgi:hypothetical protein